MNFDLTSVLQIQLKWPWESAGLIPKNFLLIPFRPVLRLQVVPDEAACGERFLEQKLKLMANQEKKKNI